MSTDTRWAIDGQPVELIEHPYVQSVANTGFDQMRGVLPETHWRRLIASGQGSRVTGYTDAGEVVFDGRLATDPQLSGGQASIAAQGYVVEARKKVDRMFIQSRDMDLWQPVDGEPYVNANGASFFGTSARIDVSTTNRIAYTVNNGETITVGAEDGAACWIEGATLSRIAFTMAYSTNMEGTGLRINLRRGTGPNITTVSVATFALNAGNNGTEKVQTMAGTSDLVLLHMENQTAVFNPANTAKLRISRIRVNSNVASGDTFNASEVISHIGTTLGWDTAGVETSTYNVLPFDWTDGGWDAAASYVAELEDKVWGVWDDRGSGPYVTYSSWGSKAWTVYQSGGAEPDLTPGEVFNQVHVWFEDPRGRLRRATATASPDPLASVGITNVYEYDLRDRQADNTLAAAVAAKLLNKVSRTTYRGRITAVKAFDATGRDYPLGVRPGDTVRIADWGPLEEVTLRVVDTVLQDGRVQLGVEQPWNLTHLLRQATASRPRRRR